MNKTARVLLYGFKQIKYIRSFQDVKVICFEKLPYLIPRLSCGHIGYKTVPPSLQLEPTNYCNLRCLSCPQHYMQRKKGYMDFSLFEKIINDAAKIGVKRVHLYLHGEPLLHTEIARMIAGIKSRQIGVSIFTNGMMLDKEMGKAILMSGVNSADYITFSIQGHSREIHERIMVGVNHDRVVQNIADFVALRRERRVNGPIIQAVFYQMPENEHEAGQYVKTWEKIVDQALCSTISKSFENYKREIAGSIPTKKKSCRTLWERMTVYWNGDVTTCLEDIDGDHVIGNLENQSIKDVWNSTGLSTIRRLHREKRFGEIPQCQRCDW